MRYYKIALIADVVPLEGNAAWQCYEQLKLAGHAVEVLKPALYPGLINEAGEVNPELLARFEDVFKPDYIATEGETAESILTKLADSDAGSESPVRHFVIYGYVGKHNFGDELIFEILCNALRGKYSGSYVTLIGHGPAEALKRHGVASVSPRMKPEINYSLNGASAVLFMAGLLFDLGFVKWSSGLIDLFQSQRDLAVLAEITQLAYMHGVPAIYAGIGAGPLSNPDAQKHIKLASLTGPRYISRDDTTTQLLLDAGVDESLITQKADLVFSLEKPAVSSDLREWLASEGLQGGDYVVVSLRGWDAMPDSMPIAAANALDDAFEKHGLRPVFLDFAPEDGAIHQLVADSMRHAGQTAFFGCAYETERALELIGASRMVVAMRLHGSIIANAFGVPSVGLSYNDKVEALYQQMGQERLLLPLDCSGTDLAEAIDFAQAHFEDLEQEIENKAAANKRLAFEAFEEVFKMIDACEQHPEAQLLYRTVSSREAATLANTQAKLERAMKERNAAQAEVKRLKARIEELEAAAAVVN